MNTSINHKTNKFGLEDHYIRFIINSIGHYPDIESARIFGSRALGNYKRTSDIDIALIGNLEEYTAGSLREFLNNAAPFLYRVDVVEYNKLSNKESVKHVDDFGVEIYKKEKDR